MLCPACNLLQPDANRFCEDCGARMDDRAVVAKVAPAKAASEPCPKCGAVGDSGSADGFCSRCGFERKSMIEGHLEVSASAHLAGVGDRGKVRARNEDFVALAAEGGIEILVVCDGVSQSQQADHAALAAATCMRDGLLKSDMPAVFKTADAMVRAIPCSASHPGEPAETTIVAALHRGNELTLGWLGDSRAYWVDAKGMRQLTTDHSWVNLMVTSGEMTLEQAMHHPNAHGITRTLGGPAGDHGSDEPSILHLKLGQDLQRPGWLLLCTDGFWDSHLDADQLAAMVMDRIAKLPAGQDAMTLARDLVDNAVRERGHDNTTVGLMFIGKELTV